MGPWNASSIIERSELAEIPVPTQQSSAQRTTPTHFSSELVEIRIPGVRAAKVWNSRCISPVLSHLAWGGQSHVPIDWPDIKSRRTRHG